MRLVQRHCDTCGALVLWNSDLRDSQRCQCGGLAKLEDPIPLPEDRGHDPYNHHGRLFDPWLMDFLGIAIKSTTLAPGDEVRLTSPTMTIFEECSQIDEEMFRPRD